MSRRLSFSSDDHPSTYYATTNGGGNRKRLVLPIKCSAAKFFGHIGAQVARAMRFVSGRKKCSRKMSSSSANLARSHSYVVQSLDSQRAEAIEDCIEFFNSSSSSLSRSNSLRMSNY